MANWRHCSTPRPCCLFPTFFSCTLPTIFLYSDKGKKYKLSVQDTSPTSLFTIHHMLPLYLHKRTLYLHWIWMTCVTRTQQYCIHHFFQLLTLTSLTLLSGGYLSSDSFNYIFPFLFIVLSHWQLDDGIIILWLVTNRDKICVFYPRGWNGHEVIFFISLKKINKVQIFSM